MVLSKQDCLTVMWSSPVRLICNCHCTFMAVLCIGAEQIKVLCGFSDDSRCTVAGHKLNDCKPWNRQRATNFEAHKDLMIAPPLDALCRVAKTSVCAPSRSIWWEVSHRMMTGTSNCFAICKVKSTTGQPSASIKIFIDFPPSPTERLSRYANRRL